VIKIIIKEEYFKWHLEAFASELFKYIYIYIYIYPYITLTENSFYFDKMYFIR